MKALVTGAAGFIGSHLVDTLLERGYEVYGIDNLSTGRMTNLDYARQINKFHFFLWDVSYNPFYSYIKDIIADMDVIFHLAATVGVRLVVDRGIATIENNVNGTSNMLRLAAERQIRFVVTSTSEVYGLSQAVPFKEDSPLCLGATTIGRWGYACSKALDEYLTLAYYREKQLPVTVARLFNCSWERQAGTYGMVVPTFIRAALSKDTLKIHGDGNQIRCFGAAPDYVDALIRLAESSNTVGEVYNIGNPVPVSINELVSKIKSLLPQYDITSEYVSYEKVFGPNFQDMAIRIPCIDKIHRAVGWEPTKSLGDIIQSVYDYEVEHG